MYFYQVYAHVKKCTMCTHCAKTRKTRKMAILAIFHIFPVFFAILEGVKNVKCVFLKNVKKCKMYIDPLSSTIFVYAGFCVRNTNLSGETGSCIYFVLFY